MRFLRTVISVLFVAIMGVSVFLFFETRTDNTIPTITSSETVIKGKCGITDKELLSYVTATDMKDGDLTDRIFVENISRFIEEGISTVTFCVSDNDNNIAKKNVKLVFEDYKKPKLTLNKDLLFETNGRVNVSDAFSIVDSIDGDITNRVTVVADGTDITETTVPIEVKVTNSMGYTYEWNFEALRIDLPTSNSKYKVKLKKYFMELKTGSKKPDFKKNIEEILKGKNEYSGVTVKIDDSELNLKKPGLYSVYYSIYDKNENPQLVKITRVIVSCEE